MLELYHSSARKACSSKESQTRADEDFTLGKIPEIYVCKDVDFTDPIFLWFPHVSLDVQHSEDKDCGECITLRTRLSEECMARTRNS